MRVADLIVRSLEAHGVARAYCVPGESYLALLDALHDSTVRTIVCRHESGAGFMAVAEAKMTGRPGVFMVSRGPGATNGSIAVHVAEQDAVPVVVLIGQVSRAERGRGAFQEVDYGQFFGGMAKGVFEIVDASKVAVTWKNQDIFDNGSSLYAGHIGFGTPKPYRDMLAKADLVIAAGTRLGDVATLNYAFPAAPEPRQQVVQIYPDAAPVGKVTRPTLVIIADPVPLLETLGQAPRVVPSARESWVSAINGFIRDFMIFRSPTPDDGVDFGEVVMAVAELAPRNAVVTTDAGN